MSTEEKISPSRNPQCHHEHKFKWSWILCYLANLSNQRSFWPTIVDFCGFYHSWSGVSSTPPHLHQLKDKTIFSQCNNMLKNTRRSSLKILPYPRGIKGEVMHVGLNSLGRNVWSCDSFQGKNIQCWFPWMVQQDELLREHSRIYVDQRIKY